METHEVDVLIVGTGAGGLTSAITAHEYGANVLVVEKSDKVGGTSATSGGGTWVPNNHLMTKHGESDSREASITYMKACIGDDVSDERQAAFVDESPKMLRFIMDKSHVDYISTPYADYFPDKPGGKDGWRTLDPVPFNAAKLGKNLDNLRDPHPQTIFMGFTITIPEASKIITKTKGWLWILMKQKMLYTIDIPMRMKTKRHRRLTGGNALLGRLYKTTLDRKIPIWLNAGMTSLVETDGKVTGAIVEKDGGPVQVVARRGVVMAAGGFESNPDMRGQYLKGPTDVKWSGAPGTNKGDAHKAAEAVGANLTLMDGAWWGPTVQIPGMDRSVVMFVERSLPGIYMVNGQGKRFVNEGLSYDVVGNAMQDYADNTWVVFDARARKKYAIGPLMPGSVKPDEKVPDYIMNLIRKADTLEELAEKIGVDKAGLLETAERVARFSETGKDEDFDKGGNAYDRYYGDKTVEPNPCLAPIERAPFYAFQARPGDIGTKGGIDVDTNAQALTKKGTPISGLYAIGNCSSSVMGHTYPGAGATLGPAMTFGYVAAKHMMGAND